MTESVNNEELKDLFLKGIEKLNTSVSSTLGPYGRTVGMKDEFGNIKVTKDGVSVAKSFRELKDPVEDFAVQLIKSVAVKSANEVGDGTTTSTLLASTFVKEGFEQIKKGSNPVLVKKGIEYAIKDIINALDDIKEEITDDKELKEVATISGNNDPEIGQLITTALDKVGREGVVAIEESKTGETQLEVVEGIQFDRGYKSPYFVTDNNSMTSVLNDCYVLIYDGNITKAQQLVGIMNHVNAESKPLLVIANDIDGEALSTLIVNKMRNIVDSVAVKSPEFGDRRKLALEDIATVTGGVVISPDKGFNLENISTEQINECLGQCRTATVAKEKTTIVDGKGDVKDIEARAIEIKNQIDNAKSAFDKEKLQERLSRMAGGVALISVGGNSELEIREKKDRVEDALYATKAAIEEGILPGGGAALIHARQYIKLSEGDHDVNLGRNIVYESVALPFVQILLNAGLESNKAYDIIFQLKNEDKYNSWSGYDIVNGKIGNMKELGILDPTKVTRLALENASSVAGTLLTTSGLVFEERKKEESNQQLF